MCVSPLNSLHKRKSKLKFIPKHINIYHVVHQFYCKFNHIPHTINYINSRSLAKLFYKVVTLFLNWLNVSFSIFWKQHLVFFLIYEVHFRYNLDFLQEFQTSLHYLLITPPHLILNPSLVSCLELYVWIGTIFGTIRLQ